jgi:2-methylcitrate dehydratase PrpD
MSATARLARFIAASSWADVPDSVRHDAKRSLLNWLGCAIGGSNAPSVELAIESLAAFSGPAQATVINRGHRFDVATAAVINGVSSSVLDFDDTHLQTVIHPSVPVASATLALAEHLQVPGEAFMHAFVIGIEAACKVGNAISPEHYAGGWHVTSTCGVIGAAAACARLLRLDETQAAYAIGMAASQSAETGIPVARSTSGSLSSIRPAAWISDRSQPNSGANSPAANCPSRSPSRRPAAAISCAA